MTTAIVVAAGKSQRMGGSVDKAFLTLGSRPVVAHALAAFERSPDVSEIVLVVRKDQLAAAEGIVRMFGLRKVRQIVPGGATRLASVRAGVEAANPDTTIFAVHDGARPAVTVKLVHDCVESARKFGSGVAAAKITDTVKSVGRNGIVSATVDRTPLWMAQTPQVFRASTLLRALAEADDKDPAITDEASAVERIGEQVRLVENEEPNPKITRPGDVALVTRLLDPA